MTKLSELNAMKQMIDAAIALNSSSLGFHVGSSKTNASTSVSTGPTRQSLAAKIELEPYPTVALPDTIRVAVGVVHKFIKAPVPMVAMSAISALTLAIRALFDVQHPEKLHSPVGVLSPFFSASGERKSTCGSLFMQIVQDYEAALAVGGVIAQPAFCKGANRE